MYIYSVTYCTLHMSVKSDFLMMATIVSRNVYGYKELLCSGW